MTRPTNLRWLQVLCAVGTLFFMTSAAKAQQVVNLTFYIYSAASLPGLPAVSVTSTGGCSQVTPPYAYPGASEFSVNLTGPIAPDATGNFKIDCSFKVTSGKNSFTMTNLYFASKSSKMYADLTTNGGATSFKTEIMDGYTGTYPYNGTVIPYAFFYLAPSLVSEIKTGYGIDAMYTYASVIPVS